MLGFSPLWLGVLLRSTFERVGFEPSVPRWEAPPKVRFATDPALEERRFEPSVPPEAIYRCIVPGYDGDLRPDCLCAVL
jgi:hypothetical protein